ncbi:hypothetical protein CPB85DRAFT_1434083 [Mucidula mucida]|nr:hypothetical protein CPB85DRAFT_1434083 [Mucidula mucida]
MPANISGAPAPPACGQCAEFYYPSLPNFCATDIYKRLASTNDPVSDIDRQLYAKEILFKVQEGVDVLATRREHLRVVVQQLEQEQARMQGVLAKCRGVLSPLRHLPQEILTEIFHFSCVDHTNLLDTSDGPWCLAQVCRRWRNIVLSTPLLWAHLHCFDSTGGKDVALRKASIPTLRRALALSDKVPLDIILHVDDLDPYADNPHVMKIYELWIEELMSVSERWKHLSLSIYQDAIPLLETVHGRIPLLETLELNSHSPRVSGEGVITAFADAPSLREVRLENINPLDYYEVDIPLSQITRMESTWVDVDEDMMSAIPHFWTHLSACPHLTHLRITHPFNVWPTDPELTALRHTALRTLTISDEHLLDMLELPCLEELHVKAPAVLSLNGTPQSCPPDMLLAILNLIVRSGCSLKSLRIVDLADAHILSEILARAPELTALKLKYSQWSLSPGYDTELEVLLQFLPFSTHYQLVPKLTSFIVHVDSASTYYMKRTIDFISSDLCDFLESRYRADNTAARLQTVEIAFRFDADIHNIWTDPDIKRLLELKQDGLNISISTMGGMPAVDGEGSPNVGYTVEGFARCMCKLKEMRYLDS